VAIRKLTILLVLSALVTSCASTYMHQYMGQNIKEIIIDNGPPVNVFDYDQKTRVFQWYWGGGQYTTPRSTTSSERSTSFESSTWTTSNSLVSGGDTVSSKGCLLSYLARWDSIQEAWIVVETRKPKALVC